MPQTPLKELILRIGSNGEIVPPKEIREYLGFTKKQQIIMSVVEDKLIIRKLHPLECIITEPPKVVISYEAWKEFRKSLGEDLEK